MPKPSSTYSRWSTYLPDAAVHTWLDFVISVIVLIIQSQLASRKKNREAEEERQGEGDIDGEGGDSVH